MKGKGIESIYLITRIFSTDYFHYYSNPALFSTYFFPFMAYGKSGPYLDNELNEKLNNIKNNKHGNYYNYATQGFGNVAFYLPQISFNYFYNQLNRYDVDKSRYFKIQHHIKDIEADKMREDMVVVLSKDKLLLKRDFLILESMHGSQNA